MRTSCNCGGSEAWDGEINNSETYEGNLRIRYDQEEDRVIGSEKGRKVVKGDLIITGEGSGALNLRNMDIAGNLIVDLPNATVENGIKVGKKVRIKDVSANSWVELVSGNSLIFESANDSLIIPRGVEPKEIYLKVDLTLITSKNLLVRADKGIKITVKKDLNAEKVKEILIEEDKYQEINLEEDKETGREKEPNKPDTGSDNPSKPTETEEDKAKKEAERQAKLVEKTLEEIRSAESLDALKAIEVDRSLSKENQVKLETAIEARKAELEKMTEEVEEKRQSKVVAKTLAEVKSSESLETLEAIKIDESLSKENQAKLETVIEARKAELERIAENAETDRQAKVVAETLGEIKSAETLEILEAIKIDESLSEENKKALVDAKAKKKIDLEENKAIEDGIKEDYDKDKEIIDQQEDTVVDYYIAQNVVDQITALKEISLESKEEVKAARVAYDALTEEQKALVTNLETLEKAEAKIKELETAKSEEERQAKVVEDQIAALGEVTLDSKDAVKAARIAYDELTEEQKALVNNIETLEKAEAEIGRLEKLEVDQKAAQAVDRQIADLGGISLDSRESVKAAKTDYDNLTAEQKKLVKNIKLLQDAEAKIKELEVAKAEAERQAKVVASTLEKIKAAESLESLDAIEIDKTLSEVNKAKLETAIEAKKIDLEENKAIEDAIKEDYDKDKEIIDQQEDTVADYYIAQNVVDQIAALGEISLESKETVKAARDAFDKLSDEQKELVDSEILDTLRAAEARIKELEGEQAEEERQAKIVTDTLGEINSADILEVLEAIVIPENLSEDNKELLADAKAKKKIDLEEDKKIEDGIKEDYDKDKEIIDEQEDTVVDYYIAQNVVDQIADLGEISLESKEAVEAARAAYDALTEAQQEFVDNLGILKDSEAKLDNLRKAALADLKNNMDEFESIVIDLLNGQKRFLLKKVRDNEINFEFLTNGNTFGGWGSDHDTSPATKNTSMRNYTRGSGLATVLGQKSGDKNSKAQKARIEAIKKYVDMNTATIDDESFGGLTGMSKIYSMKVGDFLGTKKAKAKVKDEIAEDMYLEYTINFSLPENK